MIRRLLAVVALALLSGCATAPVAVPAAGGAAVGIAATFAAVNTDADTALQVVKPINQTLCVLHPFNPASAEAEAAIAAFCSHLPDSTLGLLTQLWAIVEAVDAAHQMPAAPKQ